MILYDPTAHSPLDEDPKLPKISGTFSDITTKMPNTSIPANSRMLYSQRHKTGIEGDRTSLWNRRFWNKDCSICKDIIDQPSCCNFPCSHRFHARCMPRMAVECPICCADELFGCCSICFETIRVIESTLLSCSHVFHPECLLKLKRSNSSSSLNSFQHFSTHGMQPCPVCQIDLPAPVCIIVFSSVRISFLINRKTNNGDFENE